VFIVIVSRRVPRLLALVAGLLAVVVPATAHAQRRPESARIQVRLPSADAPMPVVIRMTSGANPAATPAEGDSRDGIATFSGLTPGTYRIELGGRTGVILLNPREVAVVDANTLEVLERRATGEGTHLTRRWFDDLASAGDLWSLIETTAPFVIADRMDNGGLGTGRSALLGSRGSSWTTARVMVGGANAIAPNLHGQMPFNPDLFAADSISIVTGLAAVDIRTPGVVVAVTPRAPARIMRGMLGAAFTTPGMVAANRHEFAPSQFSTEDWRHGHALAEGPIGARTGFLLSLANSRSRFLEGEQIPWTSRATRLAGALTHRPSDQSQVGLRLGVQRVSYPFDDRRQFRDRMVLEQGRFWQATGTWERMLDSGTFLESLVSAQSGSFTPETANSAGGTVDRVVDSFVPGPAVDARTRHWEASFTLHTPVRRWFGGHHELRAGLQAQRTTYRGVRLTQHDIAELVGDLPARIWRPNRVDQQSRRSVVEGALFVADRMSLGARLTVEAGVRVDLTRGSARGNPTTVGWTALSPRLSAQWHLGPVALFGGAGWYVDPLTVTQLAHGDPGEVAYDVHLWNDIDNDARFAEGEAGTLVARSGRHSSVASIDPDLTAPRTFEYTGGIEFRVGRHITMRSAAVWRQSTGLLASVNTGVPVSMYDQRNIFDPGEDWDNPIDDRTLLVYDRRPEAFGLDHFTLTNPDDATATYEGLETSWTMRTRPVEMIFGALAYRTRTWAANRGFGPLENDQSVLGEVFENPNARPLVQGSNFFDRSYVGKLAGTIHLPAGFHFGFSARYQDGQPFARVVVVPDVTVGPEMVHAYRTGRTRYTYTLTLDLRLQKTMTLGGRSAAVFLDVFNATAHRNEVGEDAATTPLFRRSTFAQPPLTLRIGARFGW
jgi:hypothetical protein